MQLLSGLGQRPGCVLKKEKERNEGIPDGNIPITGINIPFWDENIPAADKYVLPTIKNAQKVTKK